MKEVAVQHWEFEQRATAPMAAGIAVQTGSDLLSGAMDTAEYINNVMYSPISNRHRAKAAETTSGFIEGIDQLISSRGMTVVDGLLASHNRAVESVEQGEFYRAGKESASIAQMQLSVATVGLSAPLAAKSGVDVLKAGVRTSKAKTSASVTSEVNVGPLDSAVDVAGKRNQLAPNKPLPGTLSELETRRWYHAQEDLIPGQIDKSQPVREQALQAFQLRNEIRTDARELMSNRVLAAELDVTDPNLTLKQIVQRKYQVKGLAGEDLWADILESSTKSRPSVDKSLGLTRKK